jgi:hypothetical protein
MLSLFVLKKIGSGMESHLPLHQQLPPRLAELARKAEEAIAAHK